MSPPPGSMEHLRRHLSPVLAICDPAVRYYGGLRFDQSMDREEVWDSFGAYHFVLPRFEVRFSPAGTTLVCNLVLPQDLEYMDALLLQLDQLVFTEESFVPSLPEPVMRTVIPRKDKWDSIVRWALKFFGHSSLDKVVLARQAQFKFEEFLCPITLLQDLRANTPHCFHFCFQWDGKVAFVGASPERLFRRRGREIETEAVAGTRPRGRSEADDARLLDELFHSDKERQEHEYVRVSLHEQMGPLAESFHLDATPSEMNPKSAFTFVTLTLLERAL